MRNVMLSFLSLLFLSGIAISCGENHDDSSGDAGHDSSNTSAKLSQVPTPSEPARWEARNDFGKYFTDAGVTGSVLIYDAQKNVYLAYDTARCRTRFCPASTFKIFNSLVFLETGALRDENQVIPWDSVKRNVPEWNQDQTLRTAIKYSAVWVYQELARKVGKERLQQYLDTVGYGNRTIGGKVDEFWLDGSLRISPVEQIEFLRRLYHDDLPFSRRTIDIVKDILIKEKTEAYTYRGKTGWALRNDMSIGWFVGYLERKEGTWFFAVNIDMKGKEGMEAREKIIRNILKDMKLMEG